MDLRKKPEMEPLDEERWDRIEGRLFDRIDREGDHPLPQRSRPALAFVLAGAAAAAVLGLLSQSFNHTPVASMGPSRFVTHGDGSHIDLNGAALDVSPESALVVSGDDAHGMILVLDRGSVSCEVSPRGGRPPFIVQAGEVSVKVVGTHFTVRREGESASVQVDKGVVEVTARGELAVIRKGESWPPRALAADPPPPVTAPAPPTLPRPATTTTTTTTATTTMTSGGPKSPTPEERYEAAAELEARRPDGSIAIYRELAKGDGPWAANALFAEGRLEADRGHRTEARQLLSDYLKRFPRGANADDARQLLQRLL